MRESLKEFAAREIGRLIIGIKVVQNYPVILPQTPSGVEHIKALYSAGRSGRTSGIDPPWTGCLPL